MTTPMQNKLLQALTKSICTTDPELARQWPVMQQALNQIQAAPFVFIPEGLPNVADAFDNAGRLIISNISYAISSGTELGAPTFIAPAAANNWLGFLKGRRCRNIKGEHAEVDEVGFWVLGREDQTLNLPEGTVFSYQVDEDGRYVISGETTNEAAGGDGTPIIRFQLTASLSPGSSANALELIYDSGNYTTTGSTITVRDFSSPGRWRGASGYQGIAAWRADRNDWEIVWMETIAEFISVTLAERMSGTTSGQSNSATVDAYWNGENPGGTVTVYDTSNLFKYMTSGQKAICQYDYANAKYRVVTSGTTFWCKAQHNWSETGVINVKLMTARGGTVVGSAFDAKLLHTSPEPTPPINRDGQGKRPIAYKGMDLLVTIDDQANVVVIDERAYDAPFGDVKFQVDAGSARYTLIETGTIDMNDASGGTFTLTFNGQTTSAIAYNASPATVLAALEALSNLVPGDVTIGGSAGAVTYTFGGAIEPLQPPLELNGALLTYPSPSSTAATVTGTNVTGWGLMDGVWNDETTYGGSGIDWSTHNGSAVGGSAWPPLYLVPSTTITPSNAVLPGSSGLDHNHGVTIGYSATGVTVASHPDHQHYVAVTCSALTVDAGATYFHVVSWGDTHTDNHYTGGALAYNSGGGHSESTHTALTLSHSVTDPYHSHGNSVSDEYQKVYYKTLYPLERVNNSYEQIGV